MQRRELLAGLGALGIVGAGGATAFGVVEFGSSDEAIDTFELPRIDAPGSEPGTERVPEPGRVTYLALFATWCTTCQRKMEPLGVAAEQVADDVQFVSVTNEPIGRTVEEQDVVEWWKEHDGSWTVAHDDDLDFTRTVDAPGVPYSIVFDEDNRITWRDSGYKTAEEILARIDEA